ncbi:MAG: hypothetical protein O7A08_15190 [SAR324 cluster bacterium]|nr:hypothetical protein [SAR324 cluster bacterium]MCZ6843715.1 hypothetical protein [SAR324 cluster bacterium]
MKGLIVAGCLFMLPWTAWALGCADLDSASKIRAFVESTKAANPLWHDNLSVHLELSPCEKEECARKNRKLRKANIQNLHLVRLGTKRRAFVVKGPRAPQCSVTRGGRNFLCAECQYTANRACRSFVRKGRASGIPGTNIDASDFDLLTGKNFKTVCQEFPQNPKYFKLLSTRDKGDSPYDTIVSFYEARRGIPITVNYLAGGSLRKVYRFFPKYYVQLNGQWIATIIRARTTRGSEKRYIFETQIRVLSGGGKQPRFYFDPKDDPVLSGQSIERLFNTN